jgi:hypothetical protein
MNRRQFLVTLGSVAATHGVASSHLAAQENSAPGSSVLSLRNGSRRLDLLPGPDGYGIALFTSIKGKIDRVDAPYPVSMFYGTRTLGNLVNVAFDRARKTRDGNVASAEFTDKRSNRWEVTFRAARAANGGFKCSFGYCLAHGAAEDVFFEHSLTSDMPASGEETYVLMPGLLYDGNRLTEPAPALAIPQLAAAQNFQVDRSSRCRFRS